MIRSNHRFEGKVHNDGETILPFTSGSFTGWHVSTGRDRALAACARSARHSSPQLFQIAALSSQAGILITKQTLENVALSQHRAFKVTAWKSPKGSQESGTNPRALSEAFSTQNTGKSRGFQTKHYKLFARAEHQHIPKIIFLHSSVYRPSASVSH